MTTIETTKPGARVTGGSSPRRLLALGRAELTLLLRNKSALFLALFTPVLLTVGMRQMVGQMELDGTGLTTGTVLLPMSVGFVLLFAVYATLVGTYVVRREELVLKRLRTGEPTDGEILAAAALPSAVIALLQCAVLLGGGGAVLSLASPSQPLLVLLGLVLGMAMMTAMAAASAVVTRTPEAAQLTVMPLIMVSMLGSGIVVPLEVLPDTLATFASYLPLSPVTELVRGGWVGGMTGGDVLKATGVALVWTALAGLAVRRWFRWEPRR
ncbi:ABC transporter permease [Streptomyces sp. HNM0574]|uniref:ABC transporter permease n=1 Tax=Streptomyces sp. HNM0574 TaxID=2714954 RepID=UPI00146E613C|nr:ABC transporter permease [Streptomyces sp. HNM0574]NLU68507.1 ABC transporter permease [Streptomyces sp. HNM0574]